MVKNMINGKIAVLLTDELVPDIVLTEFNMPYLISIDAISQADEPF